MSVSSYNTNPALNTSIGGVDISEGCSPAGYNDALRQIMADIRLWTDSQGVAYPISLANGGTGATTAAAARAALGALGTAGGNVGGLTITDDSIINGKLTRQGNGVHPFWASTSATGGKMFLQASGGADPTVNPYDMVLEY